MTYQCPTCTRSSFDGNLSCPERRCPVQLMRHTLNAGQSVGAYRIQAIVHVFPTASLYSATRVSRFGTEEAVYLKIAHDDSIAVATLRREAALLSQFKTRSDRIFPKLLAPTINPKDTAQYGGLTIDGKLRVYTVLEHFEGDFLGKALIKDPHIWILDAMRILRQLVTAISAMHARHYFHLNLHPNALIVRRDFEGLPRPVLMDLGVCAHRSQRGHDDWLEAFSIPQFRAPEMYQGAFDPAQADVWGIGVVAYHMFTGRSPFPVQPLQLKTERLAQPIKREDLQGEAYTRVLDQYNPEFSKNALAMSPLSRPTPQELGLTLRLFSLKPETTSQAQVWLSRQLTRTKLIENILYGLAILVIIILVIAVLGLAH